MANPKGSGAGGRKPRPSNVHALTGDNRTERQRHELPAPADDWEFPAWFEDKEATPETIHEIWNRVDRSLRALQIKSSVDLDMMKAYVIAVHNMDRLAKVIVHAPAVIRDTNGQPTANPLIAKWEKSVQTVRTLAGHFGLAGPTSRVGLAGPDAFPGSASRADDLAG